jgi:hypothetical protein
VDADGVPIRRTAAQVAAIMQLPEKRCATCGSAMQMSCIRIVLPD